MEQLNSSEQLVEVFGKRSLHVDASSYIVIKSNCRFNVINTCSTPYCCGWYLWRCVIRYRNLDEYRYLEYLNFRHSHESRPSNLMSRMNIKFFGRISQAFSFRSLRFVVVMWTRFAAQILKGVRLMHSGHGRILCINVLELLWRRGEMDANRSFLKNQPPPFNQA